MNKKILALIVLNATFLASGIILILVSCVQFDNWWPFMTVFINMFAIFCPTFCGGCTLDPSSLWDEREGEVSLGAFSWLCLGFFVVVGYAIPVELYRSKVLSETGVYLTLSGGTVILAAILIFVRLIFFKKDQDSAYFL